MADFTYQPLPFQEAIDFLRQKRNVDTDSWRDAQGIDHDVAFVVAGAKGQVLDDLRGAVDRAISEGQTLDKFRKNFETIVQEQGWDFRGDSDWRARIIWETNLRTHYAAGRVERQLDPEVVAGRPYLMWRHGGSSEPRPTHLALDRQVYPSGSAFWDVMYPPVGYGCKCRAFSLSQRDLDRKGLTVTEPPAIGSTLPYTDGRGQEREAIIRPDQGWGAGHGRSSLAQRQEALRNLLTRLSPDMAAQAEAEAERWLISRVVGNAPPSPPARGGGSDAVVSAPVEPGPLGVPISAALRIPRGRLSDDLRRTVDIIDGLHGDGALDQIPVRNRQSRSWNGAVEVSGGRARAVLMNSTGGHRELTLAHELGHVLDLEAIGQAGDFATRQGAPEMAAWQRAVDESAAVQGLKQLQVDRPRDRHLTYLLEPLEIWARSYAQWVAVRSGDTAMLTQLDGIRTSQSGYNQRQWADEDFAAIATEIDLIMEAQGWMRR